MTLTSKKGQDYTVCRKEADKPAAARATADDVFEE
jgi:hypothetical protein